MKEEVFNRLAEEEKELVERINKGSEFTKTEDFKTLSSPDKQLLMEQLKYMNIYKDILRQRISRAQNKAAEEARKERAEKETKAAKEAAAKKAVEINELKKEKKIS